MKALPRLILLSPGDLDAVGGAPFLRTLDAALAAGLRGFLLREPRLEDRAFLELARRIRPLLERTPAVWFAVHDRAHLARALEADAVHLSFRSLPAAELRPWLGPGLALGLSTHSGDERAAWRGADYLFHGPLHETPSKAGRLAPIGLEGLRAALRDAAQPLFALGGVRPEDAREARRAGAHGVAVISGILRAPDPARATAAYLAALAGA